MRERPRERTSPTSVSKTTVAQLSSGDSFHVKSISSVHTSSCSELQPRIVDSFTAGETIMSIDKSRKRHRDGSTIISIRRCLPVSAFAAVICLLHASILLSLETVDALVTNPSVTRQPYNYFRQRPSLFPIQHKNSRLYHQDDDTYPDNRWETTATRSIRTSSQLLREKINGSDPSSEQEQQQQEDECTNQHEDRDDSASGMVLTPYQILHPSFFYVTNDETKPSSNAGRDIEKPLFAALDTLIRSVRALVDGTAPQDRVIDEWFANFRDEPSRDRDGFDVDVASTGETESTSTSSLSSSSSSAAASKSNGGVKVIRIEHTVSHPIDPLCYLHKQSKTHLLPPTIPKLYFADADMTMESAIVGSTMTFTNAADYNNGEMWDFVKRALPDGSRLYGASRFDVGLDESKRGREWKEWGDGFWVLPAVEVRREGSRSYSSATSSSSSSSTGMYDRETNNNNLREGGMSRTTLSVHLLVQPCDDDTDRRRHALCVAAIPVLDLLKRLTDGASPPIPPTTLPPIIYRDYDVGTEDSQEVFERGVEAALDAFEKNNEKNKINDEDKVQREGKGGEGTGLQKVVLARRVDLHLGAQVSGLDVMMKLKFGGHVGHLFYISPGLDDRADEMQGWDIPRKDNGIGEFFGCTPERLFRIDGRDGSVSSEALAGTRPRGSTPEADAQLFHDLCTSQKDREENMITGRSIRNAFFELQAKGFLLPDDHSNAGMKRLAKNSSFFVRRLRHLQHICQSLEGRLSENIGVVDVAKSLLQGLHPTPAVCGSPKDEALRFIRRYEATSFDRGYYAGPCGYIGKDSVDIMVAIRSALLSGGKSVDSSGVAAATTARASVYAGAGLVPGSTVQGEWAETSHKLGVISSLFAPSPVTLQSSPTPNVAWATAFVEELIRCGVTQFYICPGSRSTPLTSAVTRAIRSNVGVAHAVSVHDERGAGFRAVGYGRGTNRPAAVITSSGTAVANLYPSLVEAGMDGVPLLILTADRPYENRDSGANQAIDQVKAFSSTYVRWFRDIPPPTDDVPISVALSDANHAVSVCQQQMGPVHLNIQFRENLAPDPGPIRSDARVGSVTNINTQRFTDVPGFQRWSSGGGKWLESFSISNGAVSYPSSSTSGKPYGNAVLELVELIMQSRRGIIVVGNVRSHISDDSRAEGSGIWDTISEFAQFIGFPIMAGVQSIPLRYESSAVIPFVEHILKHPSVSKNVKPDLVIQIGTQLVSTEISKMIMDAMKTSGNQQDSETTAVHPNHVLLHQHQPSERSDPNFTVTHRISVEVGPFLKAVLSQLGSMGANDGRCTSELCPLVLLGRALQEKMPSIIHESSENVTSGWKRGSSAKGVGDGKKDMDNKREATNLPSAGALPSLTEPQVVLAISEVMRESRLAGPLFLSNSMPVRDAEFFLYPSNMSHELVGGGRVTEENRGDSQCAIRGCPSLVATNRGASGIDGIISTAAGVAEATESPTTLLVGDLATLHDLNGLHALSRNPFSSQPHLSLQGATSSSYHAPYLTTVIVNNDGGGIFSFLPIAKHGNDVGFDEYFGTPTSSFSFARGAEAFGLPFKHASNYHTFKKLYREAVSSGHSNIVEAQVVGRDMNVAVHAEISKLAVKTVDEYIYPKLSEGSLPSGIFFEKLPLKWYARDDVGTVAQRSYAHYNGESRAQAEKTLLLLHGWMGDKTEWDDVGTTLVQTLPPDWTIISVDLPGHGEAPIIRSKPFDAVRAALGLIKSREDSDEEAGEDKSAGQQEKALSVDEIAKSVLFSLANDYGIESISSVCGYSLGGRVALAMKRLCSTTDQKTTLERGEHVLPKLITDETRVILLGSYPGELPSGGDETNETTLQAIPPNGIDQGMTPAPASFSVARRAKDDFLSRKIAAIYNQSYLQSTSFSEKSLSWSSFLSKWYGVSSLWGKLQDACTLRYRKMILKRVQSLSKRGLDFAAVLRDSSPARTSCSDWKTVNPANTLFLAGERDSKYSAIGRRWSETVTGVQFVEVRNAGHALLVEAPVEVADIISDFIQRKSLESIAALGARGDVTTTDKRIMAAPSYLQAIDTPASSGTKVPGNIKNSAETVENQERTALPFSSLDRRVLNPELGTLDYEIFSIEISSDGGKKKGVFGIGWGDKAGLSEDSRLDFRSGLILNLASRDGSMVGIGEVSPLDGLHKETLDQAEKQLSAIKERLESTTSTNIPDFDAWKILALDGSLTVYMTSLVSALGMEGLFPSVKSGLEMAILSLASQACRTPLLQAMATESTDQCAMLNLLPLSGLVTRGSSVSAFKRARKLVKSRRDNNHHTDVSFRSLKVKVGHQSSEEDAKAILRSLEILEGEDSSKQRGRIRADANRAWDHASALDFARALEGLEVDALARIEFIEEPLKKLHVEDGWKLSLQMREFEQWHKKTGIHYALDESLADAAALHAYHFQPVLSHVRHVLDSEGHAGCAAFILKPAVLGLELSMGLAKLAHEFGIGAVFSSSFDSGVGLAYTAFLAALSDTSPRIPASRTYPHGIGTFTMLSSDTLSPPFASYVNEVGMLKVATLSRALYGLGLDEMRESLAIGRSQEIMEELPPVTVKRGDEYHASVSTGSTGREITIQVSLPLPFSDDIACSRFTDLPQQPRWSPWLRSVAYIDAGGETEWTLNLRGVRFSWRAISTILDDPRGIMWESVSGLRNMGVVQFIPTSEDSCLMQVKMSLITPRIVASLFQGTTIFIEDFLKNKLLKWSLEMFRDVVKADLALERGDVELGDALFGAVEGRASAIEATLAYQGQRNMDEHEKN